MKTSQIMGRYLLNQRSVSVDKKPLPRIKLTVFLICLIGILSPSFFRINSACGQNVGINQPNPDPSALLDLTATDMGVLIPRMTAAQRDAIVSPANSLQVFNTTTKCLQFYESGSWYNIACTCTPPDVPMAIAGSGATATQITVNWNAATGATSYHLDVSTAINFSSFVSGYENLDVGNVTTYNVTGLTCNTTCYYRVRAVNNCETSGNSNTIAYATGSLMGLPIVLTAGANGLTSKKIPVKWNAVVGATGYYIDVSTASDFSSYIYQNKSLGLLTDILIPGLTCGTTYYCRVRAENDCQVSGNSNTLVVVTGSCISFSSCGDVFTDPRDGEYYNTVSIGSQCWMAENLNYSNDQVNWTLYSSQCYGGNPSNCATYGRLYGWMWALAGANGSSSNPSGIQGACPVGWHVPSDAEWCELENVIEPGTDASCNTTGYRGTNTGGAMKEAGTVHWNSPNTGATNSSGFNALPGGYSTAGIGINLGTEGRFWSATGNFMSTVVFRILSKDNSKIGREDPTWESDNEYSVRCVKD